MKKKKARTHAHKKTDLSTSKIMFLSIILLFIIFEALYIVKGQNQLAQSHNQKDVAGISTSK